LAAIQRLRGRHDEAETLLQQALADRRQLAADFPALFDYQAALGDALAQVGIVRMSQNRLADAAKADREAIAIYTKLTDGPIVSGVHSQSLGNTLVHLAGVLAAQGKHREARDVSQQAVRSLQSALATNRNHPRFEQDLGKAILACARAEIALRDHVAASKRVRRFTSEVFADSAQNAEAGVRLIECAWLAWRDQKLPADRKLWLSLSYARRGLNQLGKSLIKEVQDRLKTAEVSR
jgi:tetratricopeptide (TPR) repeat protein